MKLRYIILTVLIAFIATTCELPKYPRGNEGTTKGLGGGRLKNPDELTHYDEPFPPLEPLLNDIPEGFQMGIDMSNMYVLEEAGAVFYDHDNNPKDILEIVKENGVNWVRLRLWHDHTKAYNPPGYPGDGYCDLLKTRSVGKRIKALGLKFLLNFHYSDNWADPGRQQVPYAWRDMNKEDMINALYEYTVDVLEELKAAGAAPDMIQIGNEINPGLLNETNGTGSKLDGWDYDWPAALDAASKACRVVLPDVKLAVHFADGGNATVQTFLDSFTTVIKPSANVQQTSSDGPPIPPTSGIEVDYDMIGLSWYPYYEPHKSFREIHRNLATFKERYGKETLILEGAWAWRTNFDADDMPNLFHIKEEYNTTSQMTQTDPFVEASGMVFEYGGPNNYSQYTWYYPATPENQARVLRAYLDMIVDAGGMGIYWWAGDWIAWPGLRSNWDNQTLFDIDGKALPALRVFGIKGANGKDANGQ